MRAYPGTIVVHGGAGWLDPAARGAVLDGCRRAAGAGWERLLQGGTALDAVEVAIRVLEDDPLFNAGRGAVLRSSGGIELDASLMTGEGLRAGAVAGVTGFRNPIVGARAVLEDGGHVLLAGAGAEAFLESVGLPRGDPAALVTDARREQWRERFGTVGCVARDARGTLAAGTSTGGRLGDRPGRIGDSALIGAGAYAAPSGAVSCTGQGEAIIRVALAFRTVSALGRGRRARAAARAAVAELACLATGAGGVIVLDRSGGVGWACSTAHMPVCAVYPSGRRRARVVVTPGPAVV